MKSSFLSTGLALRFYLAALIGLSFAARADFPATAAGNGNNAAQAVQWYVSDNVAPAGGPVSGGLGLSDADFNNGSLGGDAYDGGFALLVNNNYFAAPLTAALSGNVFDSTAVSFGAYTVQVKYTFFPNLPIVRAIYSFSASSATTLNLSWQVNLGSDADTRIHATSSNPAGSSVDKVNDRWFVSSDNGTHGDLINTLVRYGANYTQRPEAASIVPGAGGDLLADQYTLSLNAGENKKLMMFGVLGQLSGGVGSSATAAASSAVLFDNYQSMTAAGLFSGSAADLQNIVNWGMVVPEPGAISMAVFGLAVFAGWRRIQSPKPLR